MTKLILIYYYTAAVGQLAVAMDTDRFNFRELLVYKGQCFTNSSQHSAAE